MRDIRGSGKALAKDMRRAALTRKKSRVEEKVSAVYAQVFYAMHMQQ
jgi:hypothetical protein